METIVLFDGRHLGALIRDVAKLPGLYQSTTQKLHRKYNTYVYNGLETIAQSAIQDFYDTYDPGRYNRTEDFYNAYKITANDNIWKIELGPEYLEHKHHQEQDYVYWLVMDAGVHGGQYYNGDFYWRAGDTFERWYPIPVSQIEGGYAEEGIEDRILEESKNYIDGMQEEYYNELYSIMEPALDKIEEDLNKVLNSL